MKGANVMEKNFEMPTLNVVVFENEDVITSSMLEYVFSFGRNALPALNPFGE